MSWNKEDLQSKGHTHLQWIGAILANTTFLTYGLQNGWVSPMTKLLQSNQSPTGIPLTDYEISLVASVPCLAAVCGVSVYAFIADKYGRKIGIITIIIPQALCWIIKICPSTTATLIIARIFCGIAGGGTFGIVPMYVREITQDDIRGVVGLLMIMFQNVGLFGMYAMGAYLNYYTILWIVTVIPVLNILFMIKAPESPAFLMKIGKADESASTIATLRGLKVYDKIVQNEIDSIKNEDEMFKSIPNISFLGILKQKSWRQGFFIMISIIGVHACNGGFSIVSYASTILASSGVTIAPELQALSIPVFMIIATFASMIFVDKLGRKPILAACFILSVMSFAGLASILLVQQNGVSVPGWMPVAAIVTAVCCYSAGVSPLPFVIMSEMFNFQIRAKIMGCLVTFAWFSSFFQLLSFGPIVNTFGAYIAFYIFAVINLLGAAVVLVFLPETKGKSVEQIEINLKGK